MRKPLNHRLLLTGVGIGLTVFGLAPASASSANLSHSYKTDGKIEIGSLVSLNPSKSDYVVPANTDNAKQLFGIVVEADDSLLAVDASTTTTQVATSGSAKALVSTLNGNINVGDQVGVSPFNGIGTRAVEGDRVVGLAQTALDDSAPNSTTQEVTDKLGRKKTITIGYISVGIGVGTANGNGQSGTALQRFAQSVTGHMVSMPRVIASLFVISVAFIALVTLIYSAIYGSIVSIGRNPLAKYAIFRTLRSVLLMAGATAIVALFTVYLLLR